MPHRGRTNNPSYVPLVAEQLAHLKQCPVQAVAEATSTNFERLFRRVTEPRTGAYEHDKVV
jgi:TatD DNase family protein